MMKNLTILTLCTVASVGYAGENTSANFQQPVMLTTVGGDPVSSDGWAVPYVVDVDGDGKDDLLVGQFTTTKMPWLRKADQQEGEVHAGTVRYYRNISTGDTPVYAAGVDLQAEQGPMSAPNW